MRRPLAIAVACLVPTALVGCTGDDGESSSPAADRVGIELPDTDDLSDAVLPGLVEGEVAFAAYDGRPVVVNFFASTCAPCVREMPAFESVKQQLGDRVAFVGVATNDPVEAALELVERTGVTWDLARDPQGEFIDAVGGVVLPTTLIADADGRIVEVHSGELGADDLLALLAEVGVEP